MLQNLLRNTVAQEGFPSACAAVKQEIFPLRMLRKFHRLFQIALCIFLGRNALRRHNLCIKETQIEGIEIFQLNHIAYIRLVIQPVHQPAPHAGAGRTFDIACIPAFLTCVFQLQQRGRKAVFRQKCHPLVL